MTDTERIERTAEAFRRMGEALGRVAEELRRWWEAIRQALCKVVETVTAWFINVRRRILVERLLRWGLPFFLAWWIGLHCPVRWLPALALPPT